MSVRLVLLIAAVVVFLIDGVVGYGYNNSTWRGRLIAFGLALFAASAAVR